MATRHPALPVQWQQVPVRAKLKYRPLQSIFLGTKVWGIPKRLPDPANSFD